MIVLKASYVHKYGQNCKMTNCTVFPCCKGRDFITINKQLITLTFKVTYYKKFLFLLNFLVHNIQNLTLSQTSLYLL